MVHELASWMNEADPDYGVFAVGELSEEDQAWFSDVLPDFNVTLVSWEPRKLTVLSEGNKVELTFDGKKWSVKE